MSRTLINWKFGLGVALAAIALATLLGPGSGSLLPNKIEHQSNFTGKF